MDGGGRIPTRSFELLGPLRVTVEGRPIDLGGMNRRAVLALLLAADGASVAEDVLIDTLWGGAVTDRVRNNLQSHVSRLRAALDPARHDGAGPQIVRTPGGYALPVEPGELDLHRVESLATSARELRQRDPASAVRLLAKALGAWRGRPLEEFAPLTGWHGSGLAAMQVRLAGLETAIHDDLLDVRVAAGKHIEALAELEQSTAERPLEERIHRLLALALYRSGRPTEALTALRDYRARLVDEAGLDPSGDVEALERAILVQDATLAAPPVAIASARSVVPRTWARRTSLHGRDADLARVWSALDTPGLVTVTGPGGMGKTRLAMEVAAGPDAGRAPDDRSTDVIEVLQLATVHRGEDLVPALASVLDVHAVDERSLEDAVIEHLRHRPSLLVLDNCEHLVAEVAGLVDRLLADAPALRVLATSRERLGIAGEQVVPLGPLTVPPRQADADPRDGEPRPGHGNGDESEAVQLFLARASEIRPDLRLDETSRPLIRELCRRLDGLPLAIELAAGQLGSLGLADLHDHLGERLDLLSPARSTTTLRQVVDRSYSNLDEHERELFDRLSVFNGGFGLAAIERLVAGTDLAPVTIRTLARLVDTSMVTVSDDGHGRLRYGLLETLRLYGAERLDDRGGTEDTAARHVAWAVEFTETAERGLEGSDEAFWADRIGAELANIRTAWHTSVHRDDLASASRLAVALASYALVHGNLEIRAWARQLVEDPRLPATTDVVAVHVAAAQASLLHGDLDETQRLLDAGDRLGADQTEGSRPSGWLVANRAILALFRGAQVDAERFAMEAYQAVPASSLWRVFMLGDVALARLYRGDIGGARARVPPCEQVAAELGSPTGRAWARYVDGEVALVDDPRRAATTLEEAVGIARSVGAAYVEGVALVALLSALARGDDRRRALHAFPDAIRHWRRTGMWIQQWTTLRILAELLVAIGIDEPAVVLLAAADRAADAPAVTGRDADRTEELWASVRARLGLPRFEAAHAHGARITPSEIVGYSLDTAIPAAEQRIESGTTT